MFKVLILIIAAVTLTLEVTAATTGINTVIITSVDIMPYAVLYLS